MDVRGVKNSRRFAKNCQKVKKQNIQQHHQRGQENPAGLYAGCPVILHPGSIQGAWYSLFERILRSLNNRLNEYPAGLFKPLANFNFLPNLKIKQ